MGRGGGGGGERGRESCSNRKGGKKETSPPLRLVRVCKERVAGGIVVARGTFLGSYEFNSKGGGRGVRLLLISKWIGMIYIQLFRERLSEKVHATIPKGVVGGFVSPVLQRNLKELARKAMKMCLRVLMESNKSRFDSYSR